MPKVGMKPLRRKQLIAAAISSIHEYGLADATLARIARKAGVSTGIIHHYFDDKNDLIFEIMRSLLETDSILTFFCILTFLDFVMIYFIIFYEFFLT